MSAPDTRRHVVPVWVEALALVAVIVAALLLFGGCAQSGPSSDTPAPTSSATVEPEPVATPAPTPTGPTLGCAQFVADSETVVTLAAQALELSGQGIDALAAGDYDEADRITEDLNALNEELGDAVPDYQSSRAECEAGR